MKITEVFDGISRRKFLQVAKDLYCNNKYWICPLDNQIEEIFDPRHNSFFKHGKATRWILEADNGKTIGRVAAFINAKKAYSFDQPTGGMGFFECIDNREAAFLLFDTAQGWLKEQGMQAMDGPINFGENDNFWGLLVEGFEHPPGYGMQYHHSYYKIFFENYGFKIYFDQISNHLDLTKPFPERFWKIAAWVAGKPGYSFEHYTFRNQDKYVNDFADIYNTAWAFHENFTPINKEDVKATLLKGKKIIKEEFIWFAYYEREPIAFLVMFPDVNQLFARLNGKMNLLNKLKIAYCLKKKIINRARIVIMGVKPKYQKSGIESAIFWYLDKVMKKNLEYKEIELSWVGDFNPKMRALHESVGAIFAKRHVTYRYIFSQDIDFQRSSIIPADTKEKALKEKKKFDNSL